MDIEQLYKRFCAFGAGTKDVMPLMDGAHFGKFFRDLKLLDKKLTSTAVDIIFAKAKAKTDRKITCDQFRNALVMCAAEKYPNDPNSMRKLEQKILDGAGPTTSGTTKVANKEHVERMTDTALYTGLHKERFDEEGKGRGLVGRDHAVKGQGHVPSLMMDQPGYVSGYKSAGTYSTGMKNPSKPDKDDVLDRLTDTSKYTGSHKHRFDSSGRGKGIAGRDLAAKGSAMSPGSVSSQAAYVSGYRNQDTYGKKK